MVVSFFVRKVNFLVGEVSCVDKKKVKNSLSF